MKDIKLAVGRKLFNLKCDERDVNKLNELSASLNKIVNSNMLKYRGLSDDNIFLLTAFELLDGQNNTENSNNNTEPQIVKEIIKEAKIPLPILYHPYPKTENSRWSMDLFGQDINNDSKEIDLLLENEENIEKNIYIISSQLNNIIISLTKV